MITFVITFNACFCSALAVRPWILLYSALLWNIAGRMRSNLILTFALPVSIALCVLSVPASLFKVGLLDVAQTQSKLVEFSKFLDQWKLFISFHIQCQKSAVLIRQRDLSTCSFTAPGGDVVNFCGEDFFVGSFFWGDFLGGDLRKVGRRKKKE